MQPSARETPSGDPTPQTPPASTPAGPGVPDAGPACTCGHGRQAHEHYRRGSDCALCDCARFRRRRHLRLGLRRR
jgi:hypothetical protein